MVFTMPGLVVVIHMDPLFALISMMIGCFAVLAVCMKEDEKVVQLTEEDSFYGLP